MSAGTPREYDPTGRVAVAQIALVGLFVTALVTSQVTASKLLAFSLPVALPLVGGTITLPGAALAYALTFFASDCYSELYGRRAAQVMINVAFVMNFVLLALVASTILAPVASNTPVGADTFASVLGPSVNVVAGSLLAYLISQNWDVAVFHWLRDVTDGDLLWLRNLGSTATSQALDTVLFIGVAFAIAPLVFGTGSPLPVPVLVSLVVGQYLFKLLVAVVDTPFVYAVVALVGRDAAREVTPTVAD